MKVETISIGNELIYGRIVDTNAAFLAKRLSENGLTVCFHTVVGDGIKDIKTALSVAVERADTVIITGGLGPTIDDLTRQAISEFIGRKLLFDEKVWHDIKTRLLRKSIKISDSNKRQAMIPEGADAIKNPMGTAPGICTNHNNKIIMALPGVPSEMKLMVDDMVIPYIQEKINSLTSDEKGSDLLPDRFMVIKDVNTFGISESKLGDKIAHLMGEEKNPLVGTQASISGIKVRLSARADSQAAALMLIDNTMNEAKLALGSGVYGEDEDRLEDAVFDLLKRHQMTIGVAESCTGGLTSNLLTNVPGISEFFIEGVVTYSNSAKMMVLGVPEEVLIAHGAVSPQVALAMAHGICNHAGTDIGIGITGIAGPGGETPEKPVGLVYIAVNIKGSAEVKEHHFSGNRLEIKSRTAHNAINMVRIKLKEITKKE